MKILICLLLITLFASCDYFNDTCVCNQMKNEIVVKLTFDSVEFKTWSGGMLVRNVTKTFNNWGNNLIPINIDTINYVSTYSIKPDACGKIEGGNNRSPNFHFYKEIEIIYGLDTLRLLTKEQMRNAFDADRKDPKVDFDLLILEDGKITSR